MPSLFNVLLNILYLVVLLAGIVGGYFGLKTALAKSASAVEERVRKALETENTLLQKRIRTLEGRMRLLIGWFAKQGVLIDFDGDALTIKDTKNGTVIVQQQGEKVEGQ